MPRFCLITIFLVGLLNDKGLSDKVMQITFSSSIQSLSLCRYLDIGARSMTIMRDRYPYVPSVIDVNTADNPDTRESQTAVENS